MSALTGKTPGTPNNTYTNLLHNEGTTFATGSQISLGGGSATGLVLWDDSIGIHNGTARVKFSSSATGEQTITFPDGSGAVVLSTGEGLNVTAFNAVLGKSVVTLAATASVSSDTLATIGSFAFTPASGGLYTFEMYLMLETAATGTGVKIAVTGPTVDYVSFRIRTSSSSATGFDRSFEQAMSSFGVSNDVDTLAFADEPVLCRVTGIMKLAGAPSANVEIQLASEFDTQTVKLLIGSSMVFEKIN